MLAGLTTCDVTGKKMSLSGNAVMHRYLIGSVVFLVIQFSRKVD